MFQGDRKPLDPVAAGFLSTQLGLFSRTGWMKGRVNCCRSGGGWRTKPKDCVLEPLGSPRVRAQRLTTHSASSHTHWSTATDQPGLENRRCSTAQTYTKKNPWLSLSASCQCAVVCWGGIKSPVSSSCSRFTPMPLLSRDAVKFICACKNMIIYNEATPKVMLLRGINKHWCTERLDSLCRFTYRYILNNVCWNVYKWNKDLKNKIK